MQMPEEPEDKHDVQESKQGSETDVDCSDSIPNLEQVLSQQPVNVTRYAYDKINAYARIVSELIGSPHEIVGLLVGEAGDGSCTAYDAYLVQGQRVTPSEAQPERGAFAKTFAKVTLDGNSVVGMWHSHGPHSTFHSTPDNNYLRHVLITGSYLYETALEIDGVVVPYASSVVVNSEGSDYACAIFEHDGRREIVDDIGLVVSESDGVVVDDVIREEILDNVKHSGRYLRETAEVKDDRVLCGSIKQYVCRASDYVVSIFTGMSGVNAENEDK